ncbi:NrtA/SsuA/CpmA family ABC transporter substrate-binding protein [Streptomyces sp. NBC_00053]|uniref:NrtA/SsuA/CpmA family ABC transporter substrate-binding protein n=1 Tax=unclassified Streptomyces TaxID=2593676 RepID=UPI000F5BC47A|nr:MULTISPECIES: NrtA/SsuA/CpmA family ABC transporter substrate-binding protein [unclassified Streptomyces]MCX5104513.1 NrtA/SsuA/CpmA family ABC transporter substrate-binding protein [Streptomyces sp. NBC_00439]MCX5164436.1 NrtA/SsuA/CpmA family ABC transporter substrate-binding protein [Streptomyces sp. NBC_00305]MCX5222960.1 NrtA/SsuA/CpmA family ABC transporter substrate-binding protein [Streptomyces sp. NBC_00264]MCX5504559.1 NrtA/SsuA/CpmA family ABC transporter substrate-binding protein
MNLPRPLRTAAAPALLTATALLALTACGSSEADSGSGAGGTVEIRIPDPGNSGVLALGKKDGSLDKALAKAGAKVRWTGSAGPFAPAAQAMNANQLDIATGSITSGITSLAQRPGFKFFTAVDPDAAGEGILVKNGSGIGSVADLVGKKVAVNQGGTGEYLLLKALAKAGIPAEKVERVYLRPDQTAAVFNAGKVDAWAVWATYAVAEIGSGKAHFVADGAAIGSDNYSLNAVRTGFAEQHPGVVKALYRYLHDASAKEKQDPAAYLNVFTDVGPTAVTGKAKEVQTAFTREGGTVDAIGPQDIERFEDVAGFYAEQKVTPDKVDVATHLLDIEKLK